jgi:hypothetical protein
MRAVRTLRCKPSGRRRFRRVWNHRSTSKGETILRRNKQHTCSDVAGRPMFRRIERFFL